MTNRPQMPLDDALAVLAGLRSDQLVVSTMSAARQWPRHSQHPFDFQYLPSAMGQGALVGLGLALAQPAREVIVLSGDGSLLMNLGCLVTIAASGARNLTLVLLDNGVYEVTGGQAHAGTKVTVDYAGLARAAGWPSTHAFTSLDDWRRQAASCLSQPGPRFISLAVAHSAENYQLPTPEPIVARCEKLRAALTSA